MLMMFLRINRHRYLDVFPIKPLSEEAMLEHESIEFCCSNNSDESDYE